MELTKIKIDEHLTLKLKGPADALAFFTLIQVQLDYLGRWLSWVDQLTSVTQQELILQAAADKSAKLDALDYGIYYDEQLIGSVSFNDISVENQFADLGYWLSQDFQGQLLMSKCVQKLIEIGFGELNLHKIIIEAAADNLPSNRLAQRLGFTLEAQLREQIKLRDGFHDLNIYSLFNES